MGNVSTEWLAAISSGRDYSIDEKKKGCGGSLGGSAAAMAATALVASTVFIGVRKRRTAEK